MNNHKTHSQLIRALRMERNLTQIQLSSGICSRTSLTMFENHGSYLSADLLFQFLEKLNILPNEYLILYNHGKKNIKGSYIRKLDNAIFNINISEIKKVNYSFYKLYCDTSDVFYLYLTVKAQIFLSYKKINQVDESMISRLKKYLQNVDSFGYFEFLIYTTILPYYSKEERKLFYPMLLKKIKYLDHSNRIHNCAIRLIVTELTLAISEKDFDMAKVYSEDLFNFITYANSPFGRLMYKALKDVLSNKPRKELEIVLQSLNLAGYNEGNEPLLHEIYKYIK